VADALQQAISALEDADRALHGAWQMLSAICDNDPSRDRIAARDRALKAWERNGAALVELRSADGVPASVPVNRPATMEEAQHAAQIGACLPNGVLFDAFGHARERYVRVTLDGSHLILHPRELDAFKANEEEPERFTYTDVYLSPEEADALPEFDGF
jgi:hypothetical protein